PARGGVGAACTSLRYGCARRSTRRRRTRAGALDRQRPSRHQQPQPQDPRSRSRRNRTARAEGTEEPRGRGRKRPRIAGRSYAHGQGRRLRLPDRRKLYAQTRRRGGRARHPEEGGMSRKLTHFDEGGNANMVDVGGKGETERVAVACASVTMQAATLKLIASKKAAKGDVLSVAQ